MADELTATIPDAEMAKLEAMASAFDANASQELSAQEPEPAQPAAEITTPESEINPDNSEIDPEKAKERPRDALGRFTKTEDGKDIPEAERKPAEAPVEAKKPEQTATPSEYEAKKQEKQKKEQERLDRTWENVNKRKEEIEKRDRELRDREAQLQQRATTPPPPQLPVDEDGQPITSKALIRAHKDFQARAKAALNEGNYDAFNENTALAEAAMESAQKVYGLEERTKQQTAIENHRAVWNAHLQKIVEKDPNVFKLDTAIGKAMQGLMQKHGQVFGMFENGADLAYELAQQQIEAGSASELKEKLTKAEAEVARLTKATTPLGAGPTTPIQARKLDDMSTDEQMKELERMAARADAESIAA